MKRMISVAAFMIVVFGQASGVNADEIDELRELIQKQNEQLGQLQQKLDELEAKQERQKPETEEKIFEAVKDEQAAALPDSLKWLERIRISGDFRYRHEHIDRQEIKGDGSAGWRKGRDRDRIRARLMIEAMLNDEWDVAFRLATGHADIIDGEIYADPISTNQTLTDGFSNKNFWLDLAYFDYHPLKVEGLNVIGGKIKNPFYKAGKNQLTWDDDLTPEGVAGKYVMPFGESASLHFNAGGFWISEESGSADTSLWGAQAYIKQDMDNSDYILTGASFWDYANLQGTEDEFGVLLGNTDGSADPNVSTWASDFDILELFAEYGTRLGALPVAVFGSWVNNTVAITGEGKGWLVGARLGKVKDPGSMEFVYDYRDTERDAVVGAYSDSDFTGGFTGGRGHQLGLNYQLVKNVQCAVTYFHNKIALQEPNLDYRRLHADLKLKF
ncbi:MAG: putative porin [Planctomycetota bacterium]|jgi:hypothetical protein